MKKLSALAMVAIVLMGLLYVSPVVDTEMTPNAESGYVQIAPMCDGVAAIKEK